MSKFLKEKSIAVVFDRTSIFVLGAFILGCAFCYIYFANVAVRTLTMLEKSKSEMQALSLEVSEMESKRLVLDNGISNNLAESLGFVEVKNQNFIIDKSGGTSLSLRTE